MQVHAVTTAEELETLASSFVSEEEFAAGEAALGKKVHLHDDVWWVQKSRFYCKPVHEFRCLRPGKVAPSLWESLLGYSHRVDSPEQQGHEMRWNIIQGEDLREFSLERLPGKKRNNIRQGLKNCHVKIVSHIEPLLPAMKAINVVQARRFDAQGDRRAYLAASYYEEKEPEWRRDMSKVFAHPGHTFVGAFVDEHLAAYIDLIQIEDTWMFGAVKSHDDFLERRPVDALYFATLSVAARNPYCARVVNGGGEERESLTRYKSQFLLMSTIVPYHTRMRMPSSIASLARRPRLRKLDSRMFD